MRLNIETLHSIRTLICHQLKSGRNFVECSASFQNLMQI